MEAFEIGQVADLGIGQALRPSEGPAAAQTGFAERADIAFGMRPAAGVVTEIVDRGDARVERFRGRETDSVIHVIRRHDAAEGRCRGEVSLIWFFAGKAP